MDKTSASLELPAGPAPQGQQRRHQQEQLEELLFEEKKSVKNPWVPVGALITAGVLTAGLVSFKRGNSQLGQKLMRARVVVQGATVALMLGSAYYYGEDIKWRKKKE